MSSEKEAKSEVRLNPEEVGLALGATPSKAARDGQGPVLAGQRQGPRCSQSEPDQFHFTRTQLLPDTRVFSMNHFSHQD